LDEWADIPYESQSRLLKLVENKTFVPTGGDESEPLSTHFKLIVATNQDIPQMVSKGLFRQELLYRVNMNSISIIIPSLNSRKDDIDDLIDYYIQIQNKVKKGTIKYIDKKVIQKLKDTNWDDGNVRNLFGIINKLHSNAIANIRNKIEREDIKDLESNASLNRENDLKPDEYNTLISSVFEFALKRYQKGREGKFIRKFKEDLTKMAIDRLEKQSEAAKIIGTSDSYITEIKKKIRIKMDNTSIVKVLVENELFEDPNNTCVYVVHYGSMKLESDLDLLIVYLNEPESNTLCIGKFDVFALSIGKFEHLISKHDIIVSEPLIHGKLLKGNLEHWNNHKKEFENRNPNIDSLFHNISNAIKTYEATELYFNLFNNDGIKLYEKGFWHNLTFAYSYLFTTILQIKGYHPITTKTISEQYEKYRNIKAYLKSNQPKEKEETVKEMKRKLEEYKTVFMEFIK
jgi:hypothetical protein